MLKIALVLQSFRLGLMLLLSLRWRPKMVASMSKSLRSPGRVADIVDETLTALLQDFRLPENPSSRRRDSNKAAARLGCPRGCFRTI